MSRAAFMRDLWVWALLLPAAVAASAGLAEIVTVALLDQGRLAALGIG